MGDCIDIILDIIIVTIIIKIIIIIEENFFEEEEARRRPAEVTEKVLAAPRRPTIPTATMQNKPPLKAARLPFFSQAWHQVTSNALILKIVCNGYKIQFVSKPYQKKFTPRSMSNKNTIICKQKVKDFLKFKIIKIVSPSHEQFISHIFQSPRNLQVTSGLFLTIQNLTFMLENFILKWIVFQIL